MDEDQGQAGTELAGGDHRTPERVQQEIEQTRAELGDTVAALAEKADVKGQAKRAVSEAKQTVTGKVSDVKQTATEATATLTAKASEAKDTVGEKKHEFVSSARETTPESASHTGRRVVSAAKANPVPLVTLGAFAMGFLIGRWGVR